MEANEYSHSNIEGGLQPKAAPRGFALAAWLVIAFFVLAAIVMSRLPAPPTQPSAVPGVQIGNKVMELQGRLIVALSQWSSGKDRTDIIEQANALNVGSVSQRQRFIVLVAELKGPDAAHNVLEELDHMIREEQAQADPIVLTEEEQEVMRALRELYSVERSMSDGAPYVPHVEALDQHQRDLLESELGWYGELALAPEGGPDARARADLLRETKVVTVTVISAMGAFALIAFGGFIGLILFIVFVFTGSVRSSVQPVAGGRAHGIYAETFAIWMALFIALQMIAGVLGVFIPEHTLIIVFAAFLVSLCALVWPVVRGIPWATVRQEVGLHLGRSGAVEPAIGVCGYAMLIPMFILGILMTLFLVTVDAMMRGSFGGGQSPLAEQEAPAHPVFQHVLGPDLWPKIQVLLVAMIAAPIVEEIMFRGVLHRHLRDGTRSIGAASSIVVSTLIVSFIFAVIHPVPWFAIPALMSLAIGFTLLREWRGTLIAPMVAHGLHNGLVITAVILILRL